MTWLWILLAQIPSSPEVVPLELAHRDYGAAFVRMFLSLIALIALLWATVWFLRRCIYKRFQKGVGSESIQILEKRMLSPKSVLYLVEIEGERVLIAESQVEIRAVHKLSETVPKEL